MIKQVVEEKKQVDISLLYINKRSDEVAYADLWEEAKAYGVKTRLIMTDVSGHLSSEMIKRLVPNWQKSLYYISGPQRLVEASEKVLREMQIPKTKIVTDFFPGY
jgi:ferredoxin-NADP reductase